jgi:uncharacterized membrane protein
VTSVLSTRARLAVSAGAGVVAAVGAGLLAGWRFSALIGWDACALVTVVWTWLAIWPMNPQRTRQSAAREDPARAVADLLLLGASVASLLGVGFVIVEGGVSKGVGKGLLVLLAIGTVVVSWSIVHTTFALRYARFYYSGPTRGADFHDADGCEPQYSDFAYMSFTVGMTFQVSDTEVTSQPMRAAVLRHALLSYVFGVVIIAITINIVTGLAK